MFPKPSSDIAQVLLLLLLLMLFRKNRFSSKIKSTSKSKKLVQ
jgi:hypothetical protein